jgi:hypothetical protein
MDDRLKHIVDQIRARQIMLNPPLEEAGIRAFEQKHGVELPAGYRTFLRYIGDGGNGPDGNEIFRLGHYPLKELPKPEYVDLPDIGRPFPFTMMKVWEGRCDWDEYQDDLSRLHYGNLCLTDGGCALHYHLIITGPERGNVWQFAWDTGICPGGPAPEFLDWYENWLDS